ncbi:Pr6Pr family membrane protein [Methylobacterium sp. JK268]
MRRPTLPRAAAALIALAAWIGLAAGFAGVLGRTGSPGLAAWIMLGYFTNTTGLFVAVLFTALARTGVAQSGRTEFAAARWVGAAVLCTILVGVVQGLLLRGLRPLQGADVVADIALHAVLPIAVPAYWLALVPKGVLRPRDPLLIALYPLAYFAYALLRGGLTGRYPYPFMNPDRIGWSAVTGNAAGIALSFLAAGGLLVVADRALARRAAARSAMR